MNDPQKKRSAPDNCERCRRDIRNDAAVKIMDDKMLWVCVQCAQKELWGDDYGK